MKLLALLTTFALIVVVVRGSPSPSYSQKAGEDSFYKAVNKPPKKVEETSHTRVVGDDVTITKTLSSRRLGADSAKVQYKTRHEGKMGGQMKETGYQVVHSKKGVIAKGGQEMR